MLIVFRERERENTSFVSRRTKANIDRFYQMYTQFRQKCALLQLYRAVVLSLAARRINSNAFLSLSRFARYLNGKSCWCFLTSRRRRRRRLTFITVATTAATTKTLLLVGNLARNNLKSQLSTASCKRRARQNLLIGFPAHNECELLSSSQSDRLGGSEFFRHSGSSGNCLIDVAADPRN